MLQSTLNEDWHNTKIHIHTHRVEMFGVNCEMISASDMQTASSSSSFAQLAELCCAAKRGKKPSSHWHIIAKPTKVIQLEYRLTAMNNRQCGEFVVYWFQKFYLKCD